jgi:hypothetical protein
MNKHNFVWLASALLLVVGFFACDDGSLDGDPLMSELGRLSIKPAAVSLKKGSEQQFTAYSGEEKIAHSQVEWELSGGNDETTLENGLLKAAASETAEILTVTVKAEVSGKQAQAQTKVIILDNVMSHEEHGLIVSPATVEVSKGSTKTFTVTLSEGGEADSGVDWEVIGGEASTIYSDGSYSCELTVGADETATKLIVMAALTDDNDKYGTAVVTVLLPEEWTIAEEWTVADAAGFANTIAEIKSKEEGGRSIPHNPCRELYGRSGELH